MDANTLSPLRRSRSANLRSRALKVLFGLWVLATLVPGVYLMAGHLLTLPKPPPDDPLLTAGIAASRVPGSENKWMALHILYSECRCSQKVLAHLLERGARRDVFEKVLFVDDDADSQTTASLRARATSRGFVFESLHNQELAQRYHIEAAPVMAVADAANVVRYLGGYTDRKQGPNVRDEQILAELRAGRQVEALPLFGCPVSEDLKAAVDPLELKK